MKDVIKIQISSDSEYDSLVGEMLKNDQHIILVSFENSEFQIELFDKLGKLSGLKIALNDFMRGLDEITREIKP